MKNKILFILGIAVFTAAWGFAAPAASYSKQTGGIIRFGEDIFVAAGERVNGPAIAIGGSLSVAGEVNGPAMAIGGSVNVQQGALVNGPAVSLGGNSTAAAGSKVEGPLLELPQGMPLEGIGKAAAPVLAVMGGLAGGFWIAYKVFSSFGWVALAIIAWLLFPKSFETAWNSLTQKPWKSAAVGFIFWPALAILSLALLFSLIGIPALPLLALAVTVAWFWGYTTLSYGLGEKMSKGRWQPAVSVLAGAFILKAIAWVPLMGIFPCLLVGTFGVGTVLLTRFGTRTP